ncbi:MAG: MFS transporter [Candidatus Woesearchaeota archaeon]|nr:MAG: MFS transporter [Candidatus Woesearchaeota archaeon]
MLNHEHHHYAKFFLNKELSSIYSYLAINGFATSMIGIFVPLYLFVELKYSLSSILWFFIYHAVVFSIFCVISTKLIEKIGLKHTILTSMPFLILYFISLFLLKEYGWLFYVAPILLGGGNGLFWIAFHTLFVRSANKKYLAEAHSLRVIVTLIVGLVGPIIGGYIITEYGFNVLFVLVTLLSFVAAIPMLMTKDISIKSKFMLSKAFRMENFRDGVAFFGVGSATMGGFLLWPIFIFPIMGKYVLYGFLSAVADLGNIVSNLVVGRFSDKTDKKAILGTGALLYAFTNVIRGFVASINQVFLVQLLINIAFPFLDVPFHALSYKKHKKHFVEYFVFREITFNFGRIALLVFMLIFNNFVAGFIFSAVAVLGTLLF